MSNIDLRPHAREIWAASRLNKRGLYYLWMRYVVAPRILRRTTPITKPETTDQLSMHVLTGHRDVMILLWALASFYAASKTIGALTIHTDGTLTQADKALLKRLVPGARIVSKADVNAMAEKTLAKYPNVYTFFNSPLWQARKLIDPYLAAERPFILILDSDLLWFRDPPFLALALAQGDRVYAMSNNEECRMPFTDGTFLEGALSRINSGVIFFKKAAFDLARLEDYLIRTGAKQHHFLEQAGYAYTLKDIVELPVTDYTIKGVSEKDAIMRHYTGPIRRKFFIRGLPYLLDILKFNVRN